MNTIERLNRHASSRGFFAQVARLSGLSRDTVVRIATGVTPNPGVNTLKAIDEGLDRYEAETTPHPAGRRDYAQAAHAQGVA